MSERPTYNPLLLILLAATVMAYGWGYRGVVGHEGGAMVPGAMLGMAVCLASGRADWHRRSAVAGLCGAVGWAWGGSLSYMEQTFYVVSDSFPDVLYGYSCLFLMGALWAGIGGAILGLAFTMPRSRLQRLAGPFVAISGAYLVVYLYLLFTPDRRAAFELYTVENFHDGDWFAALIALAVSCSYWVFHGRDRKEAALFISCSVAWWAGYLCLTKFGGLLLAPPYRSESWGGVVGILAALIFYLWRERNRAALMLCLYGTLGGGIAFPLAVFVRHPVRVSWGPFVEWGEKAQWKIAEESFGLFMGVAIAVGVLRLLRGGLAPADEDNPRRPLDILSVFVVLIALTWVNLRRAPMDWMHRYSVAPENPILGIEPWLWYTFGGVVITALALYCLYLYANDRLAIVPHGAYGKGSLVLILILWVSFIGAFVQHFANDRNEATLLVDASFLLGVVIACWILVTAPPNSARASVPANACAKPSDPCWNPGAGHGLVWLAVPVVLIGLTAASMAMQDQPHQAARKRFGPDAYWRGQAAMLGTWKAVGLAPNSDDGAVTPTDFGVKELELKPSRRVLVTLSDGSREDDTHTWQGVEARIELAWHGMDPANPAHNVVVMRINDNRLRIPWPPDEPGGHVAVFEKVPDSQ